MFTFFCTKNFKFNKNFKKNPLCLLIFFLCFLLYLKNSSDLFFFHTLITNNAVNSLNFAIININVSSILNKTLTYCLYYGIESFVFLNIFLILSFRIKMFFRENFWNIKKHQKLEIFLLKNTIIMLIFFIILNIIFLQKNINLVNILMEENLDWIIQYKNTLLNFSKNFIFLNNFSNIFYKNIILFFFIFIFLMYAKDLSKNREHIYKNIFIFYTLLNFFLLFSIFFINCYDFFLFFTILVGINICTYSLLIFEKNDKNTREATIKYFISSTIGTLFILGSITLIFLLYKTTNFFSLHNVLIQNKHVLLEGKLKTLNNLIFSLLNIFNTPINIQIDVEKIINLNILVWDFNNFLILIFFLIGIIFKLALFPLQSWSVEVYSSIKYRLIAIFILILKLIFFIKTIQIFFFVFQVQTQTLIFLKNSILIISFLSIIFSSFAALYEDKLKKLIAFSSINQIGFIFLSISTTIIKNNDEKNYWNVIESLQAANLFTIIYTFSNLVLLWMLFQGSQKKEIIYIKELNKTPIFYLFPIIITILSFSGLPPLAGFFSKFFILYICWKNDIVIITAVTLFLTILSNYYYLKIIKITVFDNNTKGLILIKNDNVFFIKKKEKNDYQSLANLIVYLITIFMIFFFIILEFSCRICLLITINTIYII